MKFLKGSNAKYFKLFLVFIFTFLGIKIIENIPTELSWISDIYHLLMSFILALVITYLLNPVVKVLHNKCKIPKKIAILITYLSFILIIAIGALYLVPRLYNSVLKFINAFPSIKNKSMYYLHLMHMDKYIDTFFNPKSTNFSSMIKEVLSGAVNATGIIINLCLGFLISIYIIIDTDKFLHISKTVTLIVFKEKLGNDILEFFKILNHNIGAYLRASVIDSTIVAALSLIGLYCIGINYAILLALIMFLMNLIPFIGAYIGIILVFIISLFTGDLSSAIIAAIYLEIIHEFDSWFIQPKLIGSKIGLNPAVILLAITIGGAIYGPIGMILASPIASVILIYIKKILTKYKYRAHSLTIKKE